jgi:anti-sigma B factor antagonist
MANRDFLERNVDGVTILTVDGGLKGALEALLKDRIDELVGQGKLQIVVDLKQVPFIDSRDIGRIIRAHLSVRQAGGRVRLCNLSDRVRSVLKMTRLDTVLELYQTESEALAGTVQTGGTQSAPGGRAQREA